MLTFPSGRRRASARPHDGIPQERWAIVYMWLSAYYKERLAADDDDELPREHELYQTIPMELASPQEGQR